MQLTLLVRDTGASASPSELAGNWRYDLHAKLGASSPRRDVGSVTWDAAGTITGGALGTLEGSTLTPSGWSSVNVDDNGLSQRVALPGLDICHDRLSLRCRPPSGIGKRSTDMRLRASVTRSGIASMASS